MRGEGSLAVDSPVGAGSLVESVDTVRWGTAAAVRDIHLQDK